MTDIVTRTLNSPGPVSDAFLMSRAFIKVIIGPVGSGKTMTALRGLLVLAARQGGTRDRHGVLRRKARVGVIRESYPNIEKNTLPSWFDVMPQTEGKFTWSQPYTHKINLILAEDEYGEPTDICEFEIEFRAIGDRSVEEVTRGWQVVAVMVDEADLQPPELLSFLTGRVGRGGIDRDLIVDPQIILSLNAPSIDNWVYALAIENELGAMDDELRELLGDRELIEVFIQPGGREPDAENLHNLPKGYYAVQAAANRHRPGYVDRMVDNRFVPLQHGQPVNPQFDYKVHVREGLEWDPSRPLIVGVDQGLFAAAVACQRTIMGQLRTLREAVMFAEEGKTLMKIGPSAAGAMVRTMINDNFHDLRPEMLRVVADPAAWAAADRADAEMDWIRAFSAALGYPVRKAKTNRQTLRNEAIWRALAEREGYLVDARCKHLIRGHLGGYHYRKAQMAGVAGTETRGHLEIADTIHTHVCDAEQYAALEGEHVIPDIQGRPRRSGPIKVESDFDVFS
jgi:hypothetical protein